MTILNVKNLSKKYDERSGVFNFEMSLYPEDIVLLLGPNGAGKTTTMRSILGLTDSNYDELTILETPFHRKESLKSVGAMISKPVFYDYLTGLEHLEMCSYIYNIEEKQVHDILECVGLDQAKHKKVKTYSTGMKQRLDLARAIIHNPKLLVLDEPFNGLDIEAKHDFKKLLKNLQETSNIGILISSHMVGDLETFANKVIIVYEGQTLFNGTMESVKASGLSLEEFYLQRINHKKGA